MPSQKIAYSFIAVDKFTRVAKKVAAATKKVGVKMKLLARIAKRTGKIVTGAFVKMGKAAKGAITGGLAPLLAIMAPLGLAFKTFTAGLTFEEGMADLSSITKITGKDLAQLGEAALDMGKKTQTSSTEVLEAFKLVASAKSDLIAVEGGIEKVTDQVLLLKNASGIDLNAATTAVTKSLNQFGLGAEEASRVVNVLAAGSQVGASEVFETAVAVEKAGTVASAAGVSFEEFNASIQVLAKNGQTAEIAGTGLKGAILKLQGAGLGGIIKTEGLAAAFQKVKDAGLDDVAMLKMFGAESITIATILQDNTALTRDWTKQLTGSTVAQEQAATRMKTTGARLRGIGVTLNNVLIRAFDKFGPQIDAVVTKFEKWADSITPEQIAAVAEALKPVLSLMGDLAIIALTVAKVLAPVAKLVSFAAGGIGQLTSLVSGNLDVAGSVSTLSESNINVNLNAPAGTIDSVKAETTGSKGGPNVGVNMQESF